MITETTHSPAGHAPTPAGDLSSENRKNGGARAASAGLAALASVVAASTCCLPVLPFAFAAGFASGSAVFARLRPYLLAASALFVAYGFYQAWRATRCRHQPGILNTLVLWTSAALVLASIFFPQVLANIAADLLVW